MSLTTYGGYWPHADAVARIVGIYLAFAVLVAAVLLLASAAALVRGWGVRVNGLRPVRRSRRRPVLQGSSDASDISKPFGAVTTSTRAAGGGRPDVLPDRHVAGLDAPASPLRRPQATPRPVRGRVSPVTGRSLRQ